MLRRTTANAPSRFLEEIPEEHADWQGKPGVQQTYGVERFGGDWGDGYGAFGASSGFHTARSSRGNQVKTSYAAPRKAKEPVRKAASAPVSAAPLPALAPGDRVHHEAFGDGMVTAMTPMSGDVLIEIAFDAVGTKKLLLKFAAPKMKKL